MRYLLLVLLLTGCGDYMVEPISVCVEYKPAFACKGGSFRTKAICDTKEECNKICAELHNDSKEEE